MSAEAEVLSLCDEVWKWRLVESPELASFCGFHQYDDIWDNISEEANIRREACVQEFLKKAENMDTNSCSEEVALSHALLLDDLRLYLQGVRFKTYLMPMNYLEGMHINCNLTISYMKFDTEEDFGRYISRLEKLPQRLEQEVTAMKRGVEEGVLLHESSVKGIPEQIEGILNTPIDDQGLLKPFKSEHPGIPQDRLAKFQVQAKDIVSSAVLPALQAMKEYIENDYMRHVRPCEGICTLKDGVAWYQQCLDFHLSCSMTPQQVHDVGLREVARIKEQMLKTAEKENLGQTLQEIKTNIEEKQKDAFKTQDEVLEYVKDLCYNKIRPKISSLFKDLPDMKMKIEKSPEYMKNAPAGFYLNGTPDGSREGTYSINTHNLEACLPYQLTALSLHEGEPGHHLQGIYALAATQLPDFRRYSEDAKYYMAPARFGFNTAYVEGWGLYSEALGEELDMYQDSKDLLGRYSFEIFRATRLVVDTGIHVFGWSKADAIKYMLNNTMSGETELTQEVERYITWPGQACAYKIGEMKIWDLRRKAEEKLGDQFDIKEFHHRVLACGAVPLRVLEMAVDKYIGEVQAGGQGETQQTAA